MRLLAILCCLIPFATSAGPVKVTNPNSSPVPVQSVPSTSVDVAAANTRLATVTTPQVVKASPGNVYGLTAVNGAASVCWVQCVNAAAGGALGTNIVFSVPLPASGVVTIPAGSFALGNFSTGISCGIATTNSGSVACGTAGNITVFYK